MQFQLSQDRKYFKVIKADSVQELEQLKVILIRKVKNFFFLQVVKSGQWDGSINFLNSQNQFLSGLWKYVQDKMSEFGYACQFNGLDQLFNKVEIDKKEFRLFCEDLIKDKKDLEIRDYQIDAAYNMLKYRRCGCKLATSSGKTLVAYFVLAYGLKNKFFKNVLFIVPRVDLVIQPFNEFTYYNRGNDIDMRIQQIYTGSDRDIISNITIGTYQSLVKNDPEYFKRFDCVIVDEVHTGSSKSVIKLMKMISADYRIGMTGTYPDPTTAEYLTILSNTGPIVNEISASDLISEGFATPVKITILKIDYAPLEIKESFAKLKGRVDGVKLLAKEKDFIRSNKKRFDFIMKLLLKTTKNSLVLFSSVEDGYGKRFYESLVRNGKTAFYIDGSVKTKDRETFKDIFKADNSGVILIASFAIFSTGLSLRNIYNIFMVESWKSEILINQSLGRSMRLFEGKEVATIFDIVDDLCFENRYGVITKNYVYKHMEERIKTYKENKFPYEIKNIKL